LNRYGFIRVAAAVPTVTLADVQANAGRIMEMIDEAVSKDVSLILFPKQCLTGVTCNELEHHQSILDATYAALDIIREFSTDKPITIALNASIRFGKDMSRCNIVINNGEIILTSPEEDVGMFDIAGTVFGFQADSVVDILLSPADDVADMFNADKRTNAFKALCETAHCACIYCNTGFGESSEDFVFDGEAFICENGQILSRGKKLSIEPQMIIADIDTSLMEYRRDLSDNQTNDLNELPVQIEHFPDTHFGSKLYRSINPAPFIPSGDAADTQFLRAFDLQAYGLITRLQKINCKKVVIGISGGLDSTLALLCAARCFDRLGWNHKNIIGITMPGFGTSKRTHGNADRLMELLGIDSREIDITQSCKLHLAAIGHDGTTQDLTFENAQARERTQILMDVANMESAIVIGTGDLSELALGWCTYNGDHMSNYAVNASIPKTLVRAMVVWAAHNLYGKDIAKILLDIAATPVSPELKGGSGEIEQKTEDLVGPYDLHDFFIYNTVHNGFAPNKIIMLAGKAFKGRYSKTEIVKWMKLFCKRFFTQQFKRSCSPGGVTITEVSLSPRAGFDMPSDASSACWTESIEQH